MTDLQKWRGWKEIAARLDVDEDTAFSYSVRAYDPLPVRYDHAGRSYIEKIYADAWEHRQDLPAHAFHVLKAQGMLPSQRKDGDADTSRPGRTKPAEAARRRKRAATRPIRRSAA